MTGMSTNLQTNNPVVVSAFHRALLHQFLLIALVVVVASLVWNIVRSIQYRRQVATASTSAAPTPTSAAAGTNAPQPEPVARRVLRIGFGIFWVLDGLLQLQSAMPLGLPSGVIQPSAASSPGWVQHLVNFGLTTWSNHPVQAAASAVWIQLGIGALLLLAPRGRWSRFAGLAAPGWGLVVWAFGESFGGIFGQGASWLFGTPGAAVFYCVAGALVALPDRAWSSPKLGRVVVRAMGVFFVGMAVLQAWPGRGSWQGATRGATPGSLVEMVRQMGQTSQPGFLASALRSLGRFDAAHGWGVNLLVVAVLTAIGIALWSSDVRVVRAAIAAALVVCVVVWVFVQDLGFLGGVGTDPNSMLPMALVLVSGFLAVARVPEQLGALGSVPPEAGNETEVASEAEGADEGVGDRTPAPAHERPWWDRVAPGYLARVLASIAAIAIVVVGVVPMVLAATNPNADPILAVATDGTPNAVDVAAPAFDLIDQAGRSVSLSSLAGKTVALTFLDPVCTSDCPFIAQEFRQANTLLGPDAGRVTFVAVVANPIYRAESFTNAFDRQEGLDHMQNWEFLTGSVAVLEQTWDNYGIEAAVTPAGGMVAHSELAYLIDAHGRTREVISTEPGNGSASYSSFSVYLADALERVIHA